MLGILMAALPVRAQPRPAPTFAAVASVTARWENRPGSTCFRYFYIFGNMDIDTAVTYMSALAHRTRLDAFRLLVRAGPEGLAVGAISERLRVPGATMSFHLKELRYAGVVCCRRDSRSMLYSPDFAAMNALIGFLTENCCEGTSCSRRTW